MYLPDITSGQHFLMKKNKVNFTLLPSTIVYLSIIVFALVSQFLLQYHIRFFFIILNQSNIAFGTVSKFHGTVVLFFSKLSSTSCFMRLAYTLTAYCFGSKSVTQPDASSKRYLWDKLSCQTTRTQNRYQFQNIATGSYCLVRFSQFKVNKKQKQ